MFTNDALTVIIERRWKPKCRAVRQRAKAGVDVIKTRIDQLDRNDETIQDVGYAAVRGDVVIDL